jgi:hypothetical protein
VPNLVADAAALPRHSLTAKRYLLWVAATFLLLLSVIPAALVVLADKGPTRHTSGNARWIYFFDAEKRRIADATAGPRVHLLGGSGALYSVRAKTLQARLGLPVVNHGLHAGLKADYLLRRARQVLHPGDTAVLFLEYDTFFPWEHPSPTSGKSDSLWALADYVLPFDLPYFASRSPREMLELFGALTPSEHAGRIFDSLFKKPLAGKAREQILAGLNERGDLIVNRRSEQTAIHRKSLKSYKALRAYRPSRELLESQDNPLNRFLEWSRDNDVSVIGGFPAFLDFPEYHSGPAAEYFESVAAYYRARGIPTLATPFDFMFPAEVFFDTCYHMNDVGADLMTAKVAEHVSPLLERFSLRSKASFSGMP